MFIRKPNIQLLLVALLLFLMLSLSACSPPSLLPKETPVTVLGILGDGTPKGELVEARIVLSRGKHIVDKVVPLHQNEFSTTIPMPIGQWELTVLLLDTEGVVRFQNSPQTIQVTLDQPNLVELVLRPADSQVQISIDLEHYVFRKEALRARVHFNDEIYEVKRENGQDPFETTLQLAPGSYEFKIELFTESFRAGDRLGAGVWEIVQIPANEAVSIVWSPVTKLTQITGRFETLLPSPSNLSCTTLEQGISITWDALPHPELLGYFLYMQLAPLERFELITPIPLEEPYFLYPFDPDLELPDEICFTVAGVSKGGNAGYYSPIVLWSRTKS